MTPATRRNGAILKTALIRLGQLAATVVVTWFVATQAGLSFDAVAQIDVGEWTFDWPRIVVSCLALWLGYFLNAALWGRIVHDLGGTRLPATVSVRLFMIANLGRYVPGKVWQIAGLVALARGRGVPAATASAAAVLGQGVALLSATAVGLGAVWTFADGAGWRWIAPVLVIAIPAIGLIPPVFHRAAALWFRLAKTPKPEGLSPSTAIGWLGVGVTSWLVYACAFWLLVSGLGQDAGFIVTAPAFAAAYVLGYIMVFAPAGIGIREGFLLAILSPHLGAGAAGAVAVIQRLWTTVLEVVPAAAFWAHHVASADGVAEPRA